MKKENLELSKNKASQNIHIPTKIINVNLDILGKLLGTSCNSLLEISGPPQ